MIPSAPVHTPWWNRLLPVTWLARSQAPLGLALLAALLTLPSLGSGLIADDDLHRAVLSPSPRFSELGTSPLDLFNFLDGNPERTRRLMDLGLLPWWTNLNARAAFWRPLASFTHWLDYRLWPHTPALMHAQSIAWFALGVGLLTLLYRQWIAPPWVAGLAALLYAIDDAHSVPVGFLANRNALLAVAFGVASLLLHHRWRKERKTGSAYAAGLCLLLSLLAAELGISTLAYLLAYTIFLDPAPPRRRWWALLPGVGIILAWRLCWSGLGYGMRGMGGYVDPLTNPLRFAQAVVEQLPVSLLGQWWFPPADLYGLVDYSFRMYYWAGAVVILLVLCRVLWPVLRGDAVAKFMLWGMLLSLVPACSTFPSDRILGFVGIGAMGLLARFLAAFVPPPDASTKDPVPTLPPPVPGHMSRLQRWLAAGLVMLHLVAAPALLLARSFYPLSPWINSLYVDLPITPQLRQQDVVIVAAPVAILTAYLPLRAELDHRCAPRHTWVLGPSQSDIEVQRVDDRTLRIQAPNGYLRWILDELFRSPLVPMRAGEQVHLTGLTVTVESLTGDQRPQVVRFEWDRPLEDTSLRWIQWHEGRFVPFIPPPVGQSVSLYGRWLSLLR